jgi:membrane protease YdiL (CAAX protease family)
VEQQAHEDVTFACQECGASVTFAGDRCGHVETCPECGSYVDVPERGDASLSAASHLAACGDNKREHPGASDATSRTDFQLWIEVLAVLCLAYIPYLFSAFSAINRSEPADQSFTVRMLSWIVGAFRVSMPLLVIIALAKDRWSLFGIVRPKWITDVVAGCLFCGCAFMASHLVKSLLPLSIPGNLVSARAAYLLAPDGMLAHFLLLVECIASGFSQELVYRAYLIARLERLLRSTPLAVVIATGMFGSVHVYQGFVHAMGAAAVGLVYAVSFCLLRRLWPLCVAHALHNFILYL